jgi:hypothetical protein
MVDPLTIDERLMECEITLGYATQLLAQAVAEVTKANTHLAQLRALKADPLPGDHVSDG